MIYILEGADGTGKTTLANALAEKTKGHILHCSWDKSWNMREYFTDVLNSAIKLNKYQDVIIDRWAPSEYVYGQVFRGGPSFGVFDYLWELETQLSGVKWVYCRNDNAVENHRQNKKNREEMFDDIADVVKEFYIFIRNTPELKWKTYDFNKLNMNEFIEELIA